MKLFHEHVINRPEQSFRTEVYSTVEITGRYHCHPEYELTWIETGHGLRLIGFSVETFDPGDLVLIPPGMPHRYMTRRIDRPTEPIRFRVLKFRGELLDPLLRLPEFRLPAQRLREAENTGLCFIGGASPEVARLFTGICEKEQMPRFLDFLALVGALSEAPARFFDTAKCAIDTDARVVKVIDFLQHEIGEGRSPSLADAAIRACMTPPAFSAYFRKATGKRFIDYLTEIKLGRALTLLAGSDMTVAEIALRSGFRNLSNFNRVFRTGRRMSPSVYRRYARRMAAGE